MAKTTMQPVIAILSPTSYHQTSRMSRSIGHLLHLVLLFVIRIYYYIVWLINLKCLLEPYLLDSRQILGWKTPKMEILSCTGFFALHLSGQNIHQYSEYL